MLLCCLTTLYVYGLGLLHPVRDTSLYARCTSSIEHLVDRFVYPFNEWPVFAVVSREYRLKLVSPFQLMSGTADRGRLSYE